MVIMTLLLTNHDTTPIRLFMANGDNTYTLQDDIFPREDLHGMSAGDYDNDYLKTIMANFKIIRLNFHPVMF